MNTITKEVVLDRIWAECLKAANDDTRAGRERFETLNRLFWTVRSDELDWKRVLGLQAVPTDNRSVWAQTHGR